MGGVAPACGCSDRCCGDDIRGQAPNDLPGLPHAPGAGGPGLADLAPNPKQALAADASTGGKQEQVGGKASAPIVVERRWGKPARIGGLEIGFLLPDGTEKTVSFGSVPGWPGTKLGLEFHPHKPCTVKAVHPGGFGERSGVEHGWVVQYVNGDNVFGEEVDYVFELMKRALAQAAASQSEARA
mmetsp:Transcript_6993/g.19832  ORF Transcript_6993/g.19832 Transcript_6993/m.19832 type:complete len:184 (-) Transcript_6993:206-757(-)